MKFSELEIRFLQQENATRRLKPIRDLREIGCPPTLYEKILEDRARKLGPEFAKFHDEQGTPPAASLQLDLDAHILAAKLF